MELSFVPKPHFSSCFLRGAYSLSATPSSLSKMLVLFLMLLAVAAGAGCYSFFPKEIAGAGASFFLKVHLL